MLQSIRSKLIHELQVTGQYLHTNCLTWGTSGNLSARLTPETILVTASGTALGDLVPQDFVEVPIIASNDETYPIRPTKELPMHRAVYTARPELAAVVHASPFYTTLLSCSNIEIPSEWFVESMYYLERIGRVAYAHPGSTQLGELVQAEAGKANLLLLENHGVLAYDTSLKEALMGIHTLEMAAKMYFTARGAGVELHGLPAPVVSDFLNHAGYRPRREWIK